MAITNCTLKQDATGLTPVAGTDLAFVVDGVEVNGGVHVHAPSVVDFRVRPNITFKNRNPSLLADGTYTKGKRSMSLVIPMEKLDGKICFNLIRIELEAHPELVQADVDNLAFLGGQLLGDSEILDFIRTGSLG
jgi:hypothetical protein